jgi:hypothetical protein
MWLSDQVGQPGTDLGSLPGCYHDGYNGTDSYTWTGDSYPKTIYGQCMTGSPSVDGTFVNLDVAMADAATLAVPATTQSSGKQGDGTSDGLIIQVSGYGFQPTGAAKGDAPVAGDVLCGAGITSTVSWSGPASPPMTNIQWTIQGATNNSATALAIAGYNPSAALPATPNVSQPQVTLLTGDKLKGASVHYYYLAMQPPSKV